MGREEAFNSLFEMRFWGVCDDSECDVIAFNSLFEMPARAMSLCAAVMRETFNSLFEMLRRGVDKDEMLLRLCAFNSLFEMHGTPLQKTG